MWVNVVAALRGVDSLDIEPSFSVCRLQSISSVWIRLCVSPSVIQPDCRRLGTYVCKSVRLSACMCLDMSVCISVCLSVCLSVCQSVSHKSSHTSRHYFFLIFCNKLACSKCRKVTKPDFPRKLLNFFYKQFFKKWGFWPFSRECVIIFGWNRTFE